MKKFFSASELAAKVGASPNGRVLPQGTHAFGLTPEAKEARAEKSARHERNRAEHGDLCRLLHDEKKAISVDNRCGVPYGLRRKWTLTLEASLQP